MKRMRHQASSPDNVKLTMSVSIPFAVRAQLSCRIVVGFLRIGLAIELLACRPLAEIVIQGLEIRCGPAPPGEVLVGTDDLPVLELLELVREDFRLGDHAGAGGRPLEPVIINAFTGDGDIDDAVTGMRSHDRQQPVDACPSVRE